MPWIALLGIAALYFLTQGKASASMPPALPKPTAKKTATKNGVRVTIGPAVLTSTQAKALPLGVRTPYQDSLLIKSAAKQAGVILPDQTKARAQAPGIASDVRSKGAGYDVHKLQAWQILAGVKTQTGEYDVPTQAALRRLGVTSVPTQSYSRSKQAPFAVIK